MDTAAQCNGPDIDQVMQAAERCEGMFDVTSVDFENMPVAAAKDLYVMADYLRRILPKGKRPVAMEQPEQCCARRSMFDEDANRISAWGFDIDDGEVFRANCHCLSCWTKGTFRVQFYRTEEEALLARRWHHLTT